MLYMITCTINIPPMLAYVPYMDPMGYDDDGDVVKGKHLFAALDGTLGTETDEEHQPHKNGR